MDHDFWQRRWKKNEISFHENAPNSLLVRHFGQLGLSKGAVVLVPLCGKTRDIHWLLSQGFRVLGAELSEIAVGQLFADLGVKPTSATTSSLVRNSAQNIDILQGDLFDVTAEMLGPVDAIYDRAALVALPGQMRVRYAEHIVRVTNVAPQLLVSFTYDQAAMDGPPFSVTGEEIHRLYADVYDDRSMLESVNVPGGLKGKCPATENVWALRRKAAGR